jgi:hypothetical protein
MIYLFIYYFLYSGNDFTPGPTGQPTSVPSATVTTSTTWTASLLCSPQCDLVSAAWMSNTLVTLVGQDSFSKGLVYYCANVGIDTTPIWKVTRKDSSNANLAPLSSVAYRRIRNNNYFLAVSPSAVIYVSNNGYNFTKVTTLTGSTALYGVTIGSNGYAYSAGITNGFSAIYRSIGPPYTTWSLIQLSTTNQLNGIRSYDGRRVVAVGNKGLIVNSVNFGNSWITRFSSTSDLYGISSTLSTVVFVAGKAGTILKSINAGQNWTNLTSISRLRGFTSSTNFVYNSISVVPSAAAHSSSCIYIAGSNGYMLSTKDGGVNWQNETMLGLSYAANFITIAMYTSGVGVAVDANGYVYLKYVTAPSYAPVFPPTGQPTRQPTGQPSRQPTSQPTGQPTATPFIPPSSQPTSQPTGQPSQHPALPTGDPTSQPTAQPLSSPTGQPSSSPTSLPTAIVDIAVSFQVTQVLLTQYIDTFTLNS